MTSALDEQFQRELQQTYQAELSILTALIKLKAIDGSQATLLEAYEAQVRHRIERLKQVGKLDELPVAGSTEDFHAQVDHDALQKIAYSELQAALHHGSARYATLLARKPEVTEIIERNLSELRAALAHISTASANRDKTGSSLGERLSAMFERKK
jgi:hypothetical protein